MPHHFVAAAATAATAVLLAAACSGPFDPSGSVCTGIGCDSGLTVRLEGTPPAGPVRVELLTSDGGARYVYDCPEPGRCAAGAFFPGFTGDYVRVRVTTASGAVTREARPAYTETRPNGPDCPPACRTATVTVPLPG